MDPRAEWQEIVGDRFTLARRLGAGGFGEVWEARDTHRDLAVALKILTRTGPEALLRFKAEFRGLTDLVHPNLVTLYELFGLEETWFFSMGLVRGVPFTAWVGHWEGAPSSPDAETRTSPLQEELPNGLGQTSLMDDMRSAALLGPTAPSPGGAARFPPAASWANRRWRLDAARLRDATAQLTLGVAALHRAGKIHRDLKPPNVLVEPDGRVVVLDFGLVSDQRVPFLGRDPVGTPAFMAPEQVEGTSTPASDWYSVGVMLFRALTGRLPFEGSPLGVLLERTQNDAPAVRSLAPTAPADLAELADALLRRDPGARPAAGEILARLQGRPAPADLALEDPSEDSLRSGELGALLAFGDESDEIFVGRREERQCLREALARLTPTQPLAVLVQGGSGIGKSALVRHFLREARRADPGSVVLTARCHEQESMPFKAVDGLVDSLYAHLAPLAPAMLAAQLPPDFWSLTRLFPVLRGLPARAGLALPETPPASPEPPLLTRRRAAQALRLLLASIGARRRVLLVVDDLQWGDADSAWLLTELLRPPEAPPLLFLGSYRPETPENPLAAGLRELQAREHAFAALVDLRLEPLAADASLELARRLVSGQPGAPEVDLDALAWEARGNPFFLGELVRHPEVFADPRLRKSSSDAGESSVSGQRLLEGLLRARIERLEPSARRLLELVSIAAQPLERSILAAVASSETTGHAALRAARLVRDLPGDRIDVYHDRIRQALLPGLPMAQRKALHQDLARALVAHRPEDGEALAYHLRQAGEPEEAARYAAQAADRAAAGLAFGRAADLYRLAIDLGRPQGEEAVRLWTALGEARANAGQGVGAADALLKAAGLLPDGAAAPEARRGLELTQRAGEQLLRVGHLERGLAVLAPVLEALDLGRVPPPWRAVAGFLGRRLAVRVRGLGFRERAAESFAELDLLRLDTLLSLALGLAQADPIRGARFQAEFLLHALRVGEPHRVARALAAEVAYAASLGPAQRPRSDAVRRQALALADRLGDPRLRAQTLLAAGVAEYLFGRMRDCLRHCREAEALLEADPARTAWELANAQIYIQTCLNHSGQLQEAMGRHATLVAQARDRRDRFAEVAFQTASNYLHWMVRDEPQAGLRLTDAMVPRSTGGQGRIQQWYALNSRVMLNVYAGRGEEAWRAIAELYPGLRRSLLLRLPMVRLQTHLLRCMAATAAAYERPPAAREPFLAVVAETWREVRGDPHPIAMAARCMLGAVLVLNGRDPARRVPALQRLHALAELDAAERILDGTVGMTLAAHAIRHHRGRLIGGAAGDALCRSALAIFERERVARPEAMLCGLIPDPRPPELR